MGRLEGAGLLNASGLVQQNLLILLQVAFAYLQHLTESLIESSDFNRRVGLSLLPILRLQGSSVWSGLCLA